MGAAHKKLLAHTHLQKCRERDAVTQLLREHMLRDAVNRSEIQELHHIVKYIDVDACLSSGESLLTYAAKHGSSEALEILLEAGADINAADKNGVTPLKAAIVAGAGHVVKLLVQNEADIENVDNTGLNPLHLACNVGDAQVVEALLEGGAKGGEITNNKDKTCAIILAATDGHRECIKELATHQVDLNQKDVWGYTALSKAASSNMHDCVSTLLECGADPDLGNRSGATPFQYAVIKDHCDIVKLLFKGGASVTKFSSDLPPLSAAALNGCRRCAQELLNNGAKLESADKHRRTPLYYALTDLSLIEHLYQYYPLKKSPNRIECAKLLIDSGADVERVWKARFWNTRYKSAEQVALYKLAIRANGFKQIAPSTLHNLFQKIVASGCAITAHLMWASGYTPIQTVAFNHKPPDELANEEPACGVTCKSCDLEDADDSKTCVSKDFQENVCNILNMSRSQARSLRNLCAIQIRKAVSKNVIVAASAMDLAPDLKDCILLYKY